jgi:hypothetical protein
MLKRTVIGTTMGTIIGTIMGTAMIIMTMAIVTTMTMITTDKTPRRRLIGAKTKRNLAFPRRAGHERRAALSLRREGLFF